MENITDALKMAAFVLLFLGALTIGVTTLSQARAASEAILYTKDEKNYYSFVDEDNYYNSSAGYYKTSRVVGIDTIIPTIYRYYKEKFRVEFLDKDGLTKLNIVALLDNNGNKLNTAVNFFDASDSHEINNSLIAGNQNNIKDYVDRFVKFVLLDQYKGATFYEKLKVTEEQEENLAVPDANKTQKRTIIYQLKD